MWTVFHRHGAKKSTPQPGLRAAIQSTPSLAPREDWLLARKALLAKEKELTRQRDALNAERRRLPMVRIEKDYPFEGPDGTVSLLDLFDGRRQLIVRHFMFDPGGMKAARAVQPAPTS